MPVARHPLPECPSRVPRVGERGMSLVEVVIGAIMISMVLVAVVMTLTSAGQAQQRSKVRQQMAGSADGTLEALRADKAWVAPSLSAPTCATLGCPIVLDAPTKERVTKGKDGRVFEVLATGWPVDSEGDGLGAADADRVLPDYVRVAVRVSMSAAQQEQFGTQKPFTIVSTIDMAQNAAATGTLTIQTCEVSNQVDERATINGCDRPMAQPLGAQPSPCRANPGLGFGDLLASGGSLALGCNAALDEARGAGALASSMVVRPTTTLRYGLVLTNADGTRITRAIADAELNAAQGRYTFTGIPAGRWQIGNITPGARYEIWASKAIPSTRSVSVPPNGRANALLVQRPIQGRGTHEIEFTRTIYNYETTHPTKGSSLDMQALGATVNVNTTFYYDLVVAGSNPTVPGSAFNGVVAMEPKPAGRYSGGGSAQRKVPVYFNPGGGTSRATITQLPSGLQTAPVFIDCTGDHCGEQSGATPCTSPDQLPVQNPIQGVQQVPNGGGCVTQGNWVPAGGGSSGTTVYHSDKGECYLDGNLVRGGTIRTRGPCGPAVKVGKLELVKVKLRTSCSMVPVYVSCSSPQTITVSGKKGEDEGQGGSDGQDDDVCYMPASITVTKREPVTTTDDEGNRKTRIVVTSVTAPNGCIKE